MNSHSKSFYEEGIAVIGLGYVGLPLALQFARKGIPVVGIDIDRKKIDSIINADPYLSHISFEDVPELLKSGKLSVSTDLIAMEGKAAVIMCLPTPLTLHREPDLSFVLNTAEKIAPHLKKSCLVVLESTTYPGTTDTDLRFVLEKKSGKRAGIDFCLAFSPERIDPGNDKSNFEEVPKLLGRYTKLCADTATELYQVITTVVRCEDCRTAETTKLLENIYSNVNIAMVNELKMGYGKMGVDIWEVIEAAKTKPYGYTPFYPGPGLGGHCIPIDPFYLSWKAKEYDCPSRFIELAGEVNAMMPDYVVGKLTSHLNEAGKPVKGSRTLLIGLTYKANIDDERESPTYVIWEKLEALGAEVDYYDPYVVEVPQKRRFGQFSGIKSRSMEEIQKQRFDVAVVCTAHGCIDWKTVNLGCKGDRYPECGEWGREGMIFPPFLALYHACAAAINLLSNSGYARQAG